MTDEVTQHVCEGVDAALEGLKWLRRGRLDVAIAHLELAQLSISAALGSLPAE